jgi:hypothetical protein
MRIQDQNKTKGIIRCKKLPSLSLVVGLFSGEERKREKENG